MSSIITPGQTVRSTVTFRSYVSETEQSQPEDPVDVVVTVTKTSADPDTVETLSAVYVSDGVYYADWTPTAEGEYLLEFVATFEDDSQDTVAQDFEVVSSSGTGSGSPLLSSYTLLFAAGLTPMYLAPEELEGMFADANLLDIAEQVHIYSSEVKELFSLEDDDEPPVIALDYIKAAAACSLSKVYEDTSGNEVSFRLGDLSVMTRSYTKNTINRGNAGTWCEMAYALRNEMMASRTGMKAVVKGAIWANPIPHRRIRSKEWHR